MHACLYRVLWHAVGGMHACIGDTRSRTVFHAPCMHILHASMDLKSGYVIRYYLFVRSFVHIMSVYIFYAMVCMHDMIGY